MRGVVVKPVEKDQYWYVLGKEHVFRPAGKKRSAMIKPIRDLRRILLEGISAYRGTQGFGTNGYTAGHFCY